MTLKRGSTERESREITSRFNGVDIFQNDPFPVRASFQREGMAMGPDGNTKYVSLSYIYRSNRAMKGWERRELKKRVLHRHGFISES